MYFHPCSGNRRQYIVIYHPTCPAYEPYFRGLHVLRSVVLLDVDRYTLPFHSDEVSRVREASEFLLHRLRQD